MPQNIKDVKRNHGVTDLEIVPEPDNGTPSGYCYWVWGYGTYPYGSVLHGQAKQTRIYSFDTLEEAQEEYPGVPVRNSGTVNMPSTAFVPHCPPRDFDPMDAGEAWGENDY